MKGTKDYIDAFGEPTFIDWLKTGEPYCYCWALEEVLLEIEFYNEQDGTNYFLEVYFWKREGERATYNVALSKADFFNYLLPHEKELIIFNLELISE